MRVTLLRLALGRAPGPRRPRRRRRCRRASAPPASPAGSSPAASSTSGLLVSDAPETRQRRALHPLGRARRARAAHARSAATSDALRAVVVNSGNANAATGRRGLDDAAQDAGRRRDGRRRARGPGRGRLDRRDRRPAATPTPSSRASPPRARELAPTATSAFAEAIRTTDAFAKRVALEVTLPVGHRPAERAGQGRRG